VLVAGALRGVPVSVIISLSAESTGSTGPLRITPFVHRLRVPVLFVGSQHDPWTAGGRDTRELYRAARSSAKEILVLEGDEHGVDLLSGESGKSTAGLVIRFLRQHGS
jgi:alpha-beta hydrolase superfamily lysophospholipase